MLKCDERHYFHTECIYEWVKSENFKCPFCRAPIKSLNRSQGDMSVESSGMSSGSENTKIRRRNREIFMDSQFPGNINNEE